MSSWLELREWHEVHDLGVFPWAEWIVYVARYIPMPIYDLSRILDASAVYDMAIHAVHWRGSSELCPVNVPNELSNALCAIGMREQKQQMYMARALYAHCARYTTGIVRIQDPPLHHMQSIPLMPQDCSDALAHATKTPLPALTLLHWLTSVIKFGSTRPLTLRNRHMNRQGSCGRRSRKHSPATESRAIADHVQHATDNALASITALAPDHVPHLSCHVCTVASGYVNLVLYAQPRALCDE